VEHNPEALDGRMLQAVVQPALKRRPIAEKIITTIIRYIITSVFTGYH
jgi:hypothetical protein